MSGNTAPSTPDLDKGGFIASENAAFEFKFPGENVLSSARFTLSVISSEAFFLLNCGSDEMRRSVVSLLQTHLESCSVMLDGNSASAQTLSEQTIAAVRSLAKKWLEAYSKAEPQTPLPKVPAPAHTRGQSTGSSNSAGSSAPSRPSFMALSASTTITLADISGSPFVLAYRLDGQEANAKLFVEYDGKSLLNEALLARMAASEWEHRIESQKVSSTLPTPPSTIGEKSEYFPEMESLTEGETRVKAPWWKLFGPPERTWKPKVIIGSDGSRIVLPSPPRDDEKFLYAKTRRFPLYLFGTFSFLSVSVGMWFYVLQGKASLWFGALVGAVETYLFISYFIGYCGRDFDLKKHQEVIDNNPIPSQAPSVDILLPSCGEDIEVLENTYTYVSKLDYPNYKVFVLDDADLPSVKALAAKYGFNYFCRDNRPYLKKAGNLRWSFTRTSGDFFVIYDADFCPRPDFLRTVVPYMLDDPLRAIVQTPQFFRPCMEQTWVEQGASSTQELFYRVVEVNRDRWGAAICVGSNAIYRRSALEAVGGTAEIGHSEDVHTGFYSLTRGWRVKYIPVALACGISPDNPKAFFAQQMRWCAGSTALLTNPDFWKSRLNFIQKLCYLSGFFYYAACALGIFFIPFPGLYMVWAKPGKVFFFNCFWAIPSLFYSVIIFRLWSRQRYNVNVQFVFTMQAYAYAMALKDRIFNTTASWVPSGNVAGGSSTAEKGQKTKKKKSDAALKYRNMRIVCGIWQFTTFFSLIAGTILRSLQGYHWYDFFPILIFDFLQFCWTVPFVFRSS